MLDRSATHGISHILELSLNVPLPLGEHQGPVLSRHLPENADHAIHVDRQARNIGGRGERLQQGLHLEHAGVVGGLEQGDLGDIHWRKRNTHASTHRERRQLLLQGSHLLRSGDEP